MNFSDIEPGQLINSGLLFAIFYRMGGFTHILKTIENRVRLLEYKEKRQNRKQYES